MSQIRFHFASSGATKGLVAAVAAGQQQPQQSASASATPASSASPTPSPTHAATAASPPAGDAPATASTAVAAPAFGGANAVATPSMSAAPAPSAPSSPSLVSLSKPRAFSHSALTLVRLSEPLFVLCLQPLSCVDLCRARRVCKRLRAMCTHHSLVWLHSSFDFTTLASHPLFRVSLQANMSFRTIPFEVVLPSIKHVRRIVFSEKTRSLPVRLLPIIANTCYELQHLSVRGSTSGDGDLMQHVAAIRSLRSINFAGSELMREGFTMLKSLRNLTTLDVSSSRLTVMSGAVFHTLAELRHLRTLLANDSLIDNHTIEQLAIFCPSLTDLDVSKCAQLSGSMYAALSRLSQLQHLNVQGTEGSSGPLKGEGLEGLGACRMLQALECGSEECDQVASALKYASNEWSLMHTLRFRPLNALLQDSAPAWVSMYNALSSSLRYLNLSRSTSALQADECLPPEVFDLSALTRLTRLDVVGYTVDEWLLRKLPTSLKHLCIEIDNSYQVLAIVDTCVNLRSLALKLYILPASQQTLVHRSFARLASLNFFSLNSLRTATVGGSSSGQPRRPAIHRSLLNSLRALSRLRFCSFSAIGSIKHHPAYAAVTESVAAGVGIVEMPEWFAHDARLQGTELFDRWQQYEQPSNAECELKEKLLVALEQDVIED